MTDELLPQFLFEGRELIQDAADALLILERTPPGMALDREVLDRAFRAVHTLKGSTGLFDLRPMGELLHASEDALGLLRDDPGQRILPFDALLNSLGACESWFDAIERGGALPPDAAGLSASLIRALPGRHAPPADIVPVRNGADSATPDWMAALLANEAETVRREHRDGRVLHAVRYRPVPDCFFLGDDPMALLSAVPEPVALRLEAVPDAEGVLSDPFRCVLMATLLSTASAEALRHAFRTVPDQIEIVPVPAEAALAEADGSGARLVRVDAARLDGVVDLAGELLVARNRLGALLGERAAEGGDRDLHALATAFAEIDRVARALHREAAGLRLAPLEPLFRRLPRLVRDIAAAENKTVALTVQGGGVELDRTLVERLFEPLVHMLRNAVGHGIEPADMRRAAGKPECGRIVLRAEAAGETVTVAVEDDGAGIDPERIRAIAAERGLLDPARLAALDSAGCLDLLFLPGFSTASAVTELSGRGVGMDAVRGAVEEAGGRVSLSSRPGEGTAVRISLPRALSITTALLCETGGERVAVPAGSVREIVRPRPEMLVAVGSASAFTLRDQVVPLLPLAPLLGLSETGSADGPVLVLRDRDRPVGLRVDRVSARADLLVRALDGVLSGIPGVAGTATGPDGRVLMVLDPAQLLSRQEPAA